MRVVRKTGGIPFCADPGEEFSKYAGYTDLPLSSILFGMKVRHLVKTGREAGNRVGSAQDHAGAFHGYFALGIKFLHVQGSFAYVNRFSGKSEEQEEGKAS